LKQTDIRRLEYSRDEIRETHSGIHFGHRRNENN